MRGASHRYRAELGASGRLVTQEAGERLKQVCGTMPMQHVISGLHLLAKYCPPHALILSCAAVMTRNLRRVALFAGKAKNHGLEASIHRGDGNIKSDNLH